MGGQTTQPPASRVPGTMGSAGSGSSGSATCRSREGSGSGSSGISPGGVGPSTLALPGTHRLPGSGAPPAFGLAARRRPCPLPSPPSDQPLPP